ncbi:serine hydrolase domain-containing protein [Oleiharenicola lentus]|uniref:serine hydrolase domain-containing protein n=1 Tax=Oleiharenicola lentus TaxID=2508720 RepID=UPI003F67264E
MRKLVAWLVPALLLILLPGCGAKEAALPLPEGIDQLVSSAHAEGKFSGSVLVTRKNRILYEKSFGLADLERNVPNAADTRFLAFSLLKPMTAVLVFQQIDAARLALPDPLEKFFPNLRGKPAGAATLQQLLTHTSGISEVISSHRDRRITARDLEVATITGAGEFNYSNTGYVVLGLVLEAACGKSYEALLQEKVLTPAGMRDSGLLRTGQSVPKLARGYKLEGAKPVLAELDVVPEALDGAGSLFTTAVDLRRFDEALRQAVILPEESQRRMLTQQVKGRFGYGWFLSEQGGQYFPWHQGNYRGYSAIFVRQIHRGEAIVILSNLQDADVAALRSQILRLLKAQPSS